MKKGKAPPKGKLTVMARLDVTEQRQQLLSEAFPTILNMAAQPLSKVLAAVPLMHITEARPLLQQAQVQAAFNARQFREQRLSSDIRTAYAPPIGIRGMVQGPTYSAMFTPDWAEQCPPGAIEATTSPIAYLTDLYREAKEIETFATQYQSIPLATRRPDLAGLMLDHTALNRVEPTLVLVNEILETSIRKHLDGLSQTNRLVDDALRETRYPQTLPYERYQQQINHALGRKQRSLGDVIRCVDRDYPYFKEAGAHSQHSDNALQQDTGFGPVQQGLLLEAPYFPDTGSLGVRNAPRSTLRIHPQTHLIENDVSNIFSFLKTNYGLEDITELLDTQTFCLQTGLGSDELDSLLSTGPYAPTQSPNVSPQARANNGAPFGSVYINGGQSPAIAIETKRTTVVDESGYETIIVSHHLINTSPDKLDRINRMIRLARWLDLPFDQVDRLLTASMAAQPQPDTLQITADTLRSLGLFQRLRATYTITADDFAALLDALATEGRGKTLSQFDQLFNSQALFPTPLTLDDSEFSIIPKTEAERRKVDHLCAALGMTYETYRFTAKLIEQTLAGQPLKWSNVVVSAFYRLTRLPRHLGLSTIEALALLELLDNGGTQLVSKLAGRTHITTVQNSSNSDTLSAIHSLVDFTHWLNDHRWTVAMICRTVLPAQTSPVATEAEYTLLQQMNVRLQAALITDSSFAEAGAPLTAVVMTNRKNGQSTYTDQNIDWFVKLQAYIDNGSANSNDKGLVKHFGPDEHLFETALSIEITRIIEDYDLSQELHPKLLSMIMRARGMQEALLLEGLGDYLTQSTNHTKALMQWAGGNRYQVLTEVLRVAAFSVNTRESPQVPIGDEVLQILSRLVKRAAVTAHLNLSPALIALLTEHPEWFDLTDTALSLRCVYILTQYARILSLSEQSEDTLLNYFQLVNNISPATTEGDKALIRDSGANKLATFLQWGVREVLAVTFHLHPATRQDPAPEVPPIPGVITTLSELDLVVRVCQLCRQTGLDAKAVLDLGLLTPTNPIDQYRKAAEQALSCLTDTLPNKPSGEIGQSFNSVITVPRDYLVANNPNDPGTTLIITLLDFMDKPLSNITIRWSSDEGVLSTVDDADEPSKVAVPTEIETKTNAFGISSIRLNSGSVMGIAHVVARYSLDDEVLAPNITIDCDEATLTFINTFNTPHRARANNEEAIQFEVTLIDEYQNPGINRAVVWGTDFGQFQRFLSRTNSAGKSTAELRSSPAGSSNVVAQYKTIAASEFEPVTFYSIPYFEQVRFEDFLVRGFEARLSCRLVELNGAPVTPGTVVHWSTDSGTLSTASSETNSNGVAINQFTTTQEAPVTVTVSAVSPLGPIKDISTPLTTVNPPPVIVEHSNTELTYTLGSDEELIFHVVVHDKAVGGRPAPLVEVSWWVGDARINSIKTDKSGRSVFSAQEFELGEYAVKAQIGTTADNAVSFTVVCAARIAKGEPLNSTYVLGGTTPKTLTFCTWLENGSQAGADIDVTWTTSTGETSTTQTNTAGMATFSSTTFEGAKTTITASTGNIHSPYILSARAIMPTFESPRLSSPEYFIGTEPPVYSATLTHDNTLIGGIEVSWHINGVFQKQTIAAENGRVTFSPDKNYNFVPGTPLVVKATIGTSGTSYTFASTPVRPRVARFDITLDGPVFSSTYPDTISRGATYTLTVKAANDHSDSIAGVPLTLTSTTDLDKNKITISALGSSRVSSKDGITYTLTTGVVEGIKSDLNITITPTDGGTGTVSRNYALRTFLSPYRYLLNTPQKTLTIVYETPDRIRAFSTAPSLGTTAQINVYMTRRVLDIGKPVLSNTQIVYATGPNEFFDVSDSIMLVLIHSSPTPEDEFYFVPSTPFYSGEFEQTLTPGDDA